MTRKILAGVMALGLAAAWTAAPILAQDPQQQAQEKKKETEKKEAPSFAGKWNMSMQSPDGTRQATLEIAFDEKAPTKVTGTMTSYEMGSMAVYGELDGDTLWFAVSPDGNFEIWWNATFQEDGSIAGSLEIQDYQIPWTAIRVKGK